eukprot:2598186-Amphidinium_carterae.1
MRPCTPMVTRLAHGKEDQVESVQQDGMALSTLHDEMALERCCQREMGGNLPEKSGRKTSPLHLGSG